MTQKLQIGAIPVETKRQLAKKLLLLKDSRAAPELVDRIRGTITALCDPKSPTWRFDAGMGGIMSIERVPSPYERSLINEIGKLVDGVLHKNGYRDHTIYTWQEHTLIGSTAGHAEAPYIPIGILDGKMSVSEARLAREMVVFTRSIFCYFKGVDQNLSYVPILLEQIDENGTTVRDPRVIDVQKLADFFKKEAPLAEAIERSLVAGLEKSDSFPARRD